MVLFKIWHEDYWFTEIQHQSPISQAGGAWEKIGSSKLLWKATEEEDQEQQATQSWSMTSKYISVDAVMVTVYQLHQIRNPKKGATVCQQGRCPGPRLVIK